MKQDQHPHELFLRSAWCCSWMCTTKAGWGAQPESRGWEEGKLGLSAQRRALLAAPRSCCKLSTSPSLAAHPPRRGARSRAPHTLPTPRGHACCPQPSSCKLTATALLPVTGGSSPALAPRAEREGGQRGLTPGSKVMNSEMGPHPRSLASPPPIGQPGGMSMHKALRMWSTVMPGQSYSSK